MQWTTDPSHSHLDFAVKHMGISTVRGRFKTFTGAFETNDQQALTRVTVTADAASIDTGEPKRDDHLRSPDFLDAAKYPQIKFESDAITAKGAGYVVSGTLTIHGQTKPLSFDVEVTKPIKDPYGKTRAAATGRGKLNRKDWGLNWNMALELGGWMVGEEVQFSFDLEAIAAEPAKVG
ncbi:MAG TPA: YceI family protein [bacterium]|nr:YceI family protein [bacterium]